MSIKVKVGKDLSVTTGAKGTSCGAGTLTGAAPCTLAGGYTPVQSWDAGSGWSFDAASGSIDAETGLLSLQITGNRVDGLNVHIKQGLLDHASVNPLFPRGFTMSPDNGSTRTFGSLNTSANSGSTNTFTIQTH